MTFIHKQAVIIGGGPGGLAAAAELKKNGIDDILILEREHTPGGILRQCIHDGFGLTRFGETLSGPEYAQRFIDDVKKQGIEIVTDATVIGLTQDRKVTAASKDGLLQYQADAVILTMGCRERTRGALSIPGERPAGVFTAGTAQAYINLKNKMVGKNVIILGSGDIGMIMARRMTLEGAKVQAVFEIQPYPSGLPRNIEQCLNDYQIPLYLSHTVTKIIGHNRLEAVEVSQVDENMQPIPGTEKRYDCDTLILSVGLIPENELSKSAGVSLSPLTSGPVVDESFQTSTEGIFACGNVLHVHDLVDFVSEEASNAGRHAVEYIRRKRETNSGGCSGKQEETDSAKSSVLEILPGEGVRYTVPSALHMAQMEETLKIRFRVRNVYRNCYVTVSAGDHQLLRRKKQILAPGEMEEAVIRREALADVLPAENLTEETLVYVFRHELTHCRRWDSLYKWMIMGGN